MTRSFHTAGRGTSRTTALLDWYDRHARELPWRLPPARTLRGERPDPYGVWLSEIMLQQTTVGAVKDYFAKFTGLWPDIRRLSEATEDDVLKAWAGLGYYSRARNLKKCADRIVGDLGGRFPDGTAGLRELPGIGDYTAAAIAAIAYGEPAAVVDGNVERVITRLFAIEAPLPAAKRAICRLTQEMVPEDRPGDFAQAMMDLGATVCTPKRPSCMRCPLNADCRALAEGDPECFPVKPPKKTRPLRRGAAFVLSNPDGAILLEKRPARGLLAGMTQVPTTSWSSVADGSTDEAEAPARVGWHKCGVIRHAFTHFELELTVYSGQGTAAPEGSRWWCPREALPDQALPTVMRKVVSRAMESEGRK